MVFNLHDQFEMLRADGTYDRMRATIIGRDLAVAGSTFCSRLAPTLQRSQLLLPR